jgi:hypothetical protein
MCLMKTAGGMEVELLALLTSEFDGCVWLPSISGPFITTDRSLSGQQGQSGHSGQEKDPVLMGKEPWSSSQSLNHYIELNR